MEQKQVYAYAYCRYSSHNQDDGWSIESQRSALTKYAKANQIKIKKFFIDEAKTGRNTNRAGYQKMMRALEENDVKILLVHKLDRMHRSTINQLNDIKALDKLGVRLIATADGIDTSEASSNLIATIKSALAEQQSLNLAMETRKGLMEAAKSCLHCGGTPPYGFKLNADKLLEIDETTAPAVRRIFQMYLADMGYTAIIDWLAEHNYTTQNGNRFSKTAIHSILHNEKYAGVYFYDKSTPRDENGKRNSHQQKDEYLRIEGGCPAIISMEDFQAVQKKMKKRSDKQRNYRAKRYYPLNGKVWKADSNMRFTGNVNHSNGREYYQYRCAESGIKSVNAELLEESVFFALRELLLSDEHEEAILKNLNRYANDIYTETHADYNLLKQKKAALENRLSNLIKLGENGQTTPSILNRIGQLETEISSLDRQLDMTATAAHIFTSEDMQEIRKAFIPYMMHHNTLEAKNLINNTVQKILIDDEMIQIKLKNGITATEETADFFRS